MVKFSPARTHDLYTSEQINKICSALGFPSHKQIAEMHEYLEHAAITYFRKKASQKTKLTDAKERLRFKQLANYLHKAKKAYFDISEVSQGSVFRFYEGLAKCQNPYHDELSLIREKTHEGFILKPKFISRFLDVLESAALEGMNKSSLKFKKKTDTHIVLIWLWEFSDFWEEHSNIIISEGRYDEKKTKNLSSALKILEEIAHPINQKCALADRITNSQIAEAIKMFRKNKLTEEPLSAEDFQ